MRVLPSLCSLLLLSVAPGCYASHGRDDATDGGPLAHLDATLDAPDSRPPSDAGPDAPRVCSDGDTCDDGDACTTEDRCRAGTCGGLPIVCEEAPGTCFERIGECREGGCVYEPDDSASCDDADPCTTGDACAAGACVGTAVLCDAAPPSECVDASTLRTFAAHGVCGASGCTYSPVLRACPDGCVDGACRCVPTPWVVSIVDPRTHGDGGPSADALAVDRSGGLHAFYPLRYEGDTSHTMLYAHRPPGGAWQIEPVGRGWFGVIDVDSAGAIHVVYVDEPRDGLVHGVRGPSGWTLTPVPFDDPRRLRLAIADDGVIHVAVDRQWEGLFHLSRSTSGVWTTTGIDTVTSGFLGGLAVDARSGVHVSYVTAGELRHGYRPHGGSWSTSTIATGELEDRMDLAFDPSGGLHAMWSARARPFATLVHAYLEEPSGTWNVDPVEEARRVGPYGITMAIDARGVLHSAHRGTGDHEGVRYASLEPGGAWFVESLPAPPVWISFTYGSSLALDGHGEVHVVFKNVTSALVHASRRVCP